MVVNDVYIPYLEDKSRLLILYGGAGSGKSYFAAQKIISRTKTEKPHKFLVLRKVGNTIKDSVFSDLKSVIYTNNLEREFKIHRSEYTITHLPTGNEIVCKGLDEPEKIKSISGITGMWIEEVTEFTEEDLSQLNIRIRGKKNNYIQYIYSYNPIDEDNYVVRKYVVDKDYDHTNTTILKTTYHDNYFLSEEDKLTLESYKHSNPLFYDVYCLGLPGVVDKSGKFLYLFDQDQHINPCSYQPEYPVKLSFDFNLEPFATIAYQTPERDTMNVFHQIRLNNSDIYQVCDTIKAHYPGAFFIVTGDRSGYNRTGTVRGKTSYWKIIKQELGLSDSQIRLRSKNLDLIESRVLCNAAHKSKDININPSCSELIRDAKYAKVDERGELIKDRVKNKNDFLDTYRYAIDAEWPELSRLPKKH